MLNAVKMKKLNLRIVKTFFIKMFPVGKNPEWGSGHGHIPPWSWSFLPKLVKYHLLLNSMPGFCY